MSIAFALIYRGVSESIDFAIQDDLDSKSSEFQDIVDLMIVTSYFTELILFLIINIVLWKSYKETKLIKEMLAMHWSMKESQMNDIKATNFSGPTTNYISKDTSQGMIGTQLSDFISKSKASGMFATILESNEDD